MLAPLAATLLAISGRGATAAPVARPQAEPAAVFPPPAVGPIPPELAVFERWFGKHSAAFGVDVLATADTADGDVLHAANVLAQYLDNDEDGAPDDERVAAAMRAVRATLVMFPTASGPGAEQGNTGRRFKGVT